MNTSITTAADLATGDRIEFDNETWVVKRADQQIDGRIRLVIETLDGEMWTTAYFAGDAQVTVA